MRTTNGGFVSTGCSKASGEGVKTNTFKALWKSAVSRICNFKAGSSMCSEPQSKGKKEWGKLFDQENLAAGLKARLLCCMPDKSKNTPTTSLNLSNMGLKEIPPIIFDFLAEQTHITKLNLSGNDMTVVPKGIGALTSLTELNLSGNKLRELPEELGNLSELFVLRLNNNQLQGLPESIGQLKKLTQLDVQGNKITAFPPQIGNLSELMFLNAWDNAIDALPSQMSQLTKLSILTLNENQFTEVSDEIFKLAEKVTIELGGNQFSPEAIRKYEEKVQEALDDGEPMPKINGVTNKQMAPTPLGSYEDIRKQLSFASLKGKDKDDTEKVLNKLNDKCPLTHDDFAKLAEPVIIKQKDGSYTGPYEFQQLKRALSDPEKGSFDPISRQPVNSGHIYKVPKEEALALLKEAGLLKEDLGVT